jgi:transglutaminase-like putative cysteine protease
MSIFSVIRNLLERPRSLIADMNPDLDIYLAPTAIVDSDHPRVAAYAAEAVRGRGRDPLARAVALYYAVRDAIWYDPYLPFHKPEHYRASAVLERRRAFCIGKATLLCALGRACGIPSRLGFADVRNHLATRQLLEFLGSDLFVFHGFTEFHLGGRWVKATPAFNVELCRRHRVAPLEFDGGEDSIFQAYSEDRRLFMEYVSDHGSFADVPVARIVAAWETEYGRERVRRWIEDYERSGGLSGRDFNREDVAGSGAGEAPGRRARRG